MTTKPISPKTLNTWSYLWRLMFAAPLLSLAVFILYTTYSILPLFFGLIMRAFFDTLTGEAVAGFNIYTIVALYLANRVAVQIMEILGAGSSALHYFVVETFLRRNVFRNLMQSAGHPIPHSSGEIVNRFDEDTETVADAIFAATYGLSLPIATAISVVIMWRINAPLTVAAVLPILITAILMNRIGTYIQKYHQAERIATGNVTGLLTQLLNGVQAIKVATAERPAMQRFDTLGEARQEAVVKNAVFTSIMRSINETTVSFTTGLILLFAAGMMRSGAFTVGDFALFVTYVSLGDSTIGELVGWLGRLLGNIKQAEVSLGRLAELMPERLWPTLVANDSAHLRGDLPEVAVVTKTDQDRLEVLEVKGLTYHYPESGRGIEEVDLTLTKGSFTVVTGRIGSGKSVFLQTLLGLRPMEAGDIRWNGQSVADPATFFVPPRCAYTPQVPRLFSDTLRDNILMGLDGEDDGVMGRQGDKTRSTSLERALDAAVLESDIAQLEKGLDTVVGPRGVKLSGGQIQRTAAARMFVREPELLVFDDLSSALDVETEQTMWDRLFTQRADAPACLVVSHRRAALQRADHIIVLKEGKVEDEGGLEELLARCDEMKRLWQGKVD